MRVVHPDPEAVYGLYRVVGKRDYRDHAPGDEFEAKLNRNAERRAVMRGDLVLLQRVTPDLQPGSFTFPDGWLAQSHTSIPARRREAPLSLREE